MTAIPTPGRPGRSRLVFVVGTGRCGSTLVHELLAKHPDVGFVSNLDDRLPWLSKGRWNNWLYRRLPPWMSEKGGLRYGPSEGFRALDREGAPILSAPCRDLLGSDATPWVADVVRTFFDRRMSVQRKPVFVHKFVGWPRTRFLQEIFPQARFIHIYRDGRAVANSLLQTPWWAGYAGPDKWNFGSLPASYQDEYRRAGHSFVALTGIAWLILMEAFQEARSATPAERWFDVRYEDVLADPPGRLRELLAFCGLPWTPGFSRAVARHAFRPDRRDALRADLDAASLETLDRLLGPMLATCGYS